MAGIPAGTAQASIRKDIHGIMKAAPERHGNAGALLPGKTNCQDAPARSFQLGKIGPSRHTFRV